MFQDGQRRYQELTRQFDPLNKGLICPLAGGQPSSSLTEEERYLDHRARKILTREMGHSRVSILRIYI